MKQTYITPETITYQVLTDGFMKDLASPVVSMGFVPDKQYSGEQKTYEIDGVDYLWEMHTFNSGGKDREADANTGLWDEL